MMLLYPVPEIIPDPRARFIQIFNTCHALAEKGVCVTLFAGQRKRVSSKDILDSYGLTENTNLRIERLPIFRKEANSIFRLSWNGIFHISLLSYLVGNRSRLQGHAVLYVRHLKLASFLMRFRKFLGIPIVFEVHEIFHDTAANMRKRAALQEKERRVYNAADAVICISHNLKSHLTEMGCRPEAIHVIADAVREDWLKPVHTARRGDYICYAGSLYPWKGVDTLVSAMKHLPEERLVILGGGDRLGALKALADSEGVSGRVEFTGPVPHSAVRGYLACAKILVLPNKDEGPSHGSSPLKLFEYLSAGVPVIASDIPAFREILRHHVNAFLFRQSDPEALASSVREVILSPLLAQEIAEQGRNDAYDYTYGKRAERLMRVLGQL